MEIKKVYGAYFSGTDTTKRTVTYISEKIAKELGLELEVKDFTLPDSRKVPLHFDRESLVVFGTPTIAGRVPNLLVKYLKTIEGQGALAIPIVMFGNRSFDNSLMELRDLCIGGGMKVIAGAGIVGEHSFSTSLGRGRPDRIDFEQIDRFIDKILEILKTDEIKRTRFEDYKTQLMVTGQPGPDYGGYYMPQDRHGRHIDIRKVKPVTDMDLCTDCKICYHVCPMGAIDYNDVSKTPGICIKCCACIKKCPEGAKSFTDPGYIYHKTELEELYKRRAENSFFYV